MRQFKRWLFLFSLVFSITACQSNGTVSLKDYVTSVNAACPINMGMMGDLVSIKYDDETKYVSIYFTLHDDVTLKFMKKDEQMSRQMLMMSFSKGRSTRLLTDIIDAGAGMSVVYKSAVSGASYKVSFSNDELISYRDSPLSVTDINKILLEFQLAMENNMFPAEIEEGLKLMKVHDDGDNIVYSCSVDEDSYDLSELKNLESDLKDMVKELFDDPTMNRQIGVMHSLGKGLVYHYYGERSGKSFDVVFTTYELGQYVK